MTNRSKTKKATHQKTDKRAKGKKPTGRSAQSEAIKEDPELSGLTRGGSTKPKQ